MSAILGKDCDGKPIRVGSRVQIVSAAPFWAELIGKCTEVLEASDAYPGSVVLALKVQVPWVGTVLCVENMHARTGRLRVLPDPGDWDELEKETGWKRGKTRPRVKISMLDDAGEWVEL
ncbi:MAG: hypothetical protein AAFY29_22850 [Pseudomonadota bacterium]